MKLTLTALAAAAIGFATGPAPAAAADIRTWYVYCEGAEQGDHWAVFSENFWPHPPARGYGRRAGKAAKAFFESRHGLRLQGCAAVDFVDASLARYSRSRTDRLHRRMGDRVLYFPLPPDALPGMVLPDDALPEHRSAESTDPTASFPTADSLTAGGPQGQATPSASQR